MKEEKKEKFEEERKEIFSVSLHIRTTPEQVKVLSKFLSVEELETATGHGPHPQVRSISRWDDEAVSFLKILQEVFN